MFATMQRLQPQPDYAVRFREGQRLSQDDPSADFTLFARNESHLRRILGGDWYSTALGFIRGEFRISGDLTAAIRMKLRTGVLADQTDEAIRNRSVSLGTLAESERNGYAAMLLMEQIQEIVLEHLVG